jgi:hypothetical protein
MSSKNNEHLITNELIIKPLYKKIEVHGTVKNVLLCHELKLELYCPNCGIRRIFTFKTNASRDTIDYSQNIPWSEHVTKTITHFFTFYAVADCGHQLTIHFRVDSTTHVEKIGQYPSIYEMNEQISNKSFLNKFGQEYRDYYIKACSLNSFNSNIGAMTYLRRIFEKLLIDTFNEYHEKKGFEAFTRKRMEDKVIYLKANLPTLLFEQGFNVLYQRISDGIHNLSEEQCEENFLMLKTAIEEILIEKLEAEEKKARLSSIQKQLQASSLPKTPVKTKQKIRTKRI